MDDIERLGREWVRANFYEPGRTIWEIRDEMLRLGLDADMEISRAWWLYSIGETEENWAAWYEAGKTGGAAAQVEWAKNNPRHAQTD